MTSIRFAFAALVSFSFVGLAGAARAGDLGSERSMGRHPSIPDVADVSLPFRAGAFCESPCAPPPCAPPCAPPCDPDPCCKRVTWDLTLGMWATGLNGDAKVRGNDVDVDLPLSSLPDLIPYLEFALDGQLGVNVDRWRFEFTGHYLRAGDEVNLTQRAGIDVSVTEQVYQPIVGYRVVDKRLGCNPCDPCATRFTLMPYVGVRGTSLEVERSTLAGGSVKQTKDWWSPIVGVRAVWNFQNGWSAEFDKNIGGFGIGDDLTWSLVLGARYDFNDHVGLRFGWAFLQWDYSEGSGASEFQWDVLQQGPFFGVVFAW